MSASTAARRGTGEGGDGLKPGVAAAGESGEGAANRRGTGERAGSSAPRAFKLGDYQLKQLRNGDVYKVRCCVRACICVSLCVFGVRFVYTVHA